MGSEVQGGLSWVGEGTKGGFNVSGRRPLMGTEGTQLAKLACLPQRLEEEPRLELLVFYNRYENTAPKNAVVQDLLVGSFLSAPASLFTNS